MTETDLTLAPLNYVYDQINKYLLFNNFPTTAARLKHVKRLFDGTTTFGDIKLFNDQSVSRYDGVVVLDWFVDYLSAYSKDFVRTTHKPNQKSIADILNIISNYLLRQEKGKKGKNNNHGILTDYAEDEYRRRMTFPQNYINEKNMDENFFLDYIFKSINEFEYWLQEIYYIPQKANKKDTISWQKLNRLRVPYEQLDDEQKDIYDQILNVQQLVFKTRLNLDKKTIVKLEKIIADLKYKLNALAQSPNVGRSEIEGVNRFDADNHQEYLQHAILDIFDFSNPVHIKALIENFHDLYDKYHNKPDSPIYIILTEFLMHVHNIKLSKNHRLILSVFLTRTSDKKETVELLKGMLDTTTEKMMRTLKTTISKKIAKYFEKYVGK